MHSILDLSDEGYLKAQALAGRRDEFFNDLYLLMRFKLFESWEQFIAFYLNPETR